MSQAGLVDIEGSHPQIPTSFVTNSGTAVPIANVLEILGTAVAAHGIPLETTGSGNTVTIEVQYASANATSDATKAGIASFNSNEFTVDANGFVSLIGGSLAVDSFAMQTGTSPVVPTGAGLVTFNGATVAAGSNPVRTDGTSANTMALEVQLTQAIAATDATKVGLAAFNSAFFTVDANGFVSINGTGLGETITGNTGGALSPTAGNWNIFGTSTAAGATPVQTSGSGSTLTVQVQKSQAIASTNANNVGLAAFNNTQFTVDVNGFVSLNGSGTLSTLSDDVGTVITPSAGNIQLVGHVNEQGSTKFSTVVAGTNLVNINPMSASRWIVDSLGFNGTHTTIASALTSATSGDTIFILPGTYTENPTLKAGVNLTAYGSDSSLNGTGKVIINGTCTLTAAGSVTISGIQLQTNSAALLAVTGSGASIVNLQNCYLNCSNNTGITFSSSSSSAKINLSNCMGNLGTTGISYFTASSAGHILFNNCILSNTGGSSTANTISAGILDIFSSAFSNPITSSSTAAANSFYSQIDTSAQNATCVTIGGSGNGTSFGTYYVSGTASAISISTQFTLINGSVNSSNTNAITGAGTIGYTGVSFPGTSFTINTTTQSPAGTLKGSTTTSPTAGFLGEQIRSYVTAVALANNTATSLTSISLTPGVWDVTAVAIFQNTGNNTAVQLAISANNNSFTGTNSGDDNLLYSYPTSSGGFIPIVVPVFRIVVTTTTTYYAVGLTLFSAGVNATNCRLSAKRVG